MASVLHLRIINQIDLLKLCLLGLARGRDQSVVQTVGIMDLSEL